MQTGNAAPETSMAGRVVVVTGATSGIGLVTARELAREGATVALVGRDPARVAATKEEISRTTGSDRLRAFTADLSLQADVRRLASELRSTLPRVHVLLNNAGAMYSTRAQTSEGFERTWALNVVAPYLLTHLLVSRLEESVPARVVNVASAAHRGAHLDFENLQGERRYSGYRAYARSKLALVLLTYALARRLSGRRVTVNALHPGFVATGFGRNNPGGTGAAIGFIAYLFGLRPVRGARTSIFLASDTSVAETTGQYFVRCRAVASSPASFDTAVGDRLWDVLAVQTGLPPDALTRVV